MALPTVVTGVQTGALDLLAQACLAASVILYLIILRRLAGRGRRPPFRRAAAFLAGTVVVWVAVGSDLAAYDDTNVTVHVVQHLLLMMVAPPLLVLGRPLLLAMQVAPRSVQARLARTLAAGPVRALTHPVPVWAVYFGSMAVMLDDRAVYHYLIHHPLVHDASHAWLIGIGLLFWEPLLGGASSGRRLSPAVRIVTMLATMPFEVLIGIWLRYQTRSLDPINSLADTQRAGEAFVVGATLVSTIWLLTVLVQSAMAAVREERRVSRRPDTLEWSTPWWVESLPANDAAGGP